MFSTDKIKDLASVSRALFPGADAQNGAFVLDYKKRDYIIVISNGFGWEHVSVSTKHKIPGWAAMCHFKDLFWGPEDSVIQYHPSEEHYINHHPRCLHLWRPIDQSFPCPPDYMIGPKDKP